MSKETADIYVRRRKVEPFTRDNSGDITEEFKASEQFQATAVWNGIVSHLRSAVDVRKRRVRLRSYDQCFTGADAVSTVFQYVNQKVRSSNTNQISREQATKICQVMIQLKVIDSVHDGEKTFEDSATKCFRFVGEPNRQLNLFSGVNAPPTNHFAEMLPPERCQDKTSDESLNDSIISNPGINFRSSAECCLFKRHQNDHYQSGRYQKHSSMEYIGQDTNNPFMTPLNFIRRSSLPNCAQLPSYGFRTPTPQKPTSESCMDEVLHEAALCTLLTLVDVPVLDGIVNADQGPWIAQRSSFNQQSLVFSNFNLQRFNSAPECFCSFDGRSDDDNDDWWHSALDCLELIPGGQDIYSRVVGDDGLSGAQMQMQTSDQRKRDLFYQMVGQYQCLPNALWPDCYSDLQMELYHLLMKDHLDLALKAFQLSLVILNKDVKQHIHQLVRFMRCAADDSQVRLCNKTSNRLVIERNLTGVIVKNQKLNQHQTAFLVMFIVDQMADVWKVPDDVMETVRARFSNSDDKILEKTFCRRISMAEFCRQKVELTDKSLVELMNYILDNTQMSLKEKKRRFRQFAKQHRHLYLKHFADIV